MIYHSPEAIAYGKELRKLRLLRQMTQAQLSFDTKISAQFISAFERGARYPWESARKKLHNYFDIDIESLIKVELKKNEASKKCHQTQIPKRKIKNGL